MERVVVNLCPHCFRPLQELGIYGIECPVCHYAEAIGGEIPLNRPTGPAEDDVREKRLEIHEEAKIIKVDLVKVYEKMKKWFGKA